MANTQSMQVRTCDVKRTSALLLPIAAGLVFGAVTDVRAAPANAASAPASAAATSTKDSRALMDDLMRKCKAMNGDEKAACEKDARSAAAAEAHKESGTAHR